MPIIDHKKAPETPWRQGYRRWELAGPQQGMSCELSYHVGAPGTGAPLHVHETDELIVVMEGTLKVRLGNEIHEAGPDHTLAIPPGTAHGFTVTGDTDAKMLVFFPTPNPFGKTTYLEGTRPAGV